MKRIFLTMIAASVLISCSKDAADYPQAPDNNLGTLKISAESSELLGAVTRASGDSEKDPVNLSEIIPGYSFGNYPLRVLVTRDDRDDVIDNTYYRAFNYEKLAEHNGDDFYPAGEYTVTIGTRQGTGVLPHYYDPASNARVENKELPYYSGDASTLVPRIAEGENKPYFEGRLGVTVDNGDTEADVKLLVMNSVVCVEFTENFKKYFAEGAQISIETQSAGEGLSAEKAQFEGSKAVLASFGSYGSKSVSFWIRPRGFVLKGEAKRQKRTETLEAQVVELSYSFADVKPTMRYKFFFDAEDAGGAKIEIKVGEETIEEISWDDMELNPEAPKN